MQSYTYWLQQAVQNVQFLQGCCAELAYHRHTSNIFDFGCRRVRDSTPCAVSELDGFA